MADEIYHPHDMMVRAVLSDLAEARSFLQTHLPQEVSQALRWSTLTLLESSFVDEDLRASEADFLYDIAHRSGEEAVSTRWSASPMRALYGSMCSWSISPRRIAGCGFGC